MCILNNRQFSYAVNLTFALSLSFTSSPISFVASVFFHSLSWTENWKKITFDFEFGCCCCCDCCIRTTNFVVRNLTFHFLCRLSSFQTITFVSFLFFSTMSFEFQRHTLLEWLLLLLMLCYYYWSRSLQTYIRSLMIWMTCEKEIIHARTNTHTHQDF